MSSDWSCEVNNTEKLSSALMFTHAQRADYNKVTPQNLHRATRTHSLNRLDSTKTQNGPLLIVQTEMEPRSLRVIARTNCSWFSDGRFTVWSHPQLSLWAGGGYLSKLGGTVIGRFSQLRLLRGGNKSWELLTEIFCTARWRQDQSPHRHGGDGFPNIDRNIRWYLRTIWQNGEGPISQWCQEFCTLKDWLLSELLPSFQHRYPLSLMLFCSLDLQVHPEFLGFCLFLNYQCCIDLD